MRWRREFARMLCLAALAVVTLAAQQNGAPKAQGDEVARRTGPVLSGLLDANYSWNLNRPASGVNQLRLFDHRGNAGDISYGEIALETPAEPLGFRLDLGFGRTTYFVHGAETAGSSLRYIQQAYLGVRPFPGRSVRFDFGKFVTSAGAEVIEAGQNWNYSRSLLFCWAVPFYHFGLRTTMELSPTYSAGVQLVQGWNNVRDPNSAKTLGLTGSWRRGRLSWQHTYYVGREKPDANGAARAGFRHLLDTTVLVTAGDATAFYVNLDFGSEGRASGGSDRWYGVAWAGRRQFSERWSAAARLEWFRDRDGFATGTPQTLREATLTADCRILAVRGQSLHWRIEYRTDWSDRAVFERGAGKPPARHQQTVLVGLLFNFEQGF